MTFGKFKTYIESNLVESYINQNDFKKNIRNFKQNILKNKNLSKIYSIYDQLSSPQGLSESDAKAFLEEGIDLLTRLLPRTKIPETVNEKNNYEDIDLLVYNLKIDLNERLESRRKIVNTLMQDKSTMKESVNIPIKTMINIANQTLANYVETLDEISKKEFFQIINEDSKSLEDRFEKIKEDGINKLNTILENEKEVEVKQSISETIDKLIPFALRIKIGMELPW